MEKDLRILAENRFPMSQQCALVAQKTSDIMECIEKTMASRSKEVIISFCSVLVSPHLEYCVRFCVPQFKNVRELLERAQGRTREMMRNCPGASQV